MRQINIDIDSVVYKAGCSNEEREWLLKDGDHVVASTKYKKDAKILAEEYQKEGTEITFEQIKRAGPLEYSLASAKNLVESILDTYPNCAHNVFLGGEGNYRYDIYPEYKGNRDPFSRPIHEREIREYLIKYWRAQLVHGEEVDDRVSYISYNNPNSVISSIDKDLNNTPGIHYNYDKFEEYYVSEDEATWNFATQMLTGDSGDNIPGLPGVGAGTAAKILPHPIPEWEEIVWEEYQRHGFDKEYFRMNGQLLWIRRQPNELWEPTV